MNAIYKLTICFIVVTFLSCSKDLCNLNPKEVYGSQKEVNQSEMQTIASLPKFQALLDNNPNFKVSRLIDDEYMYKMDCDQYYNGIWILHNEYSISYSKKFDFWDSFGEIYKDSTINTTPTLSHKEAINILKSEIHTRCMNYQLCIYDINGGISNAPKDFHLVWHITSNYNGANGIIDANTGEAYYLDDGVRY